MDGTLKCFYFVVYYPNGEEERVEKSRATLFLLFTIKMFVRRNFYFRRKKCNYCIQFGDFNVVMFSAQ